MTILTLFTQTTNDQFAQPHFFIPEFTGTYTTVNGNRDNFVASAQTRLYIDLPASGPGNHLIVQANRSAGDGTGGFNVALSGYIVDLP